MMVPRAISLCDLTYTQQTIAADVMPNAIGGIATFSENAVNPPSPIKLFKYPEAVIEPLKSDGIPDDGGFSNYVWNSALSYSFATAIKKAKPRTVILFGGPNYPVIAKEQEQWLREWPSVDFVIFKEGELAFSRLIQALIEERGDVEAVKRRRIPSIHSVLNVGSAVLGPRLTALKTSPKSHRPI